MGFRDAMLLPAKAYHAALGGPFWFSAIVGYLVVLGYVLIVLSWIHLIIVDFRS